MKIILKNFQLEVLIKALKYPMQYQRGKLRIAFMSLFGRKLSDIEDRRIELSIKYADKDAKNEPVVELTESGPEYKLTPANRELFKTEAIAILTEDSEIEIPPQMEKHMGELSVMLNNTKVELDENETLILTSIIQDLRSQSKGNKIGERVDLPDDTEDVPASEDEATLPQ